MHLQGMELWNPKAAKYVTRPRMTCLGHFRISLILHLAALSFRLLGSLLFHLELYLTK